MPLACFLSLACRSLRAGGWPPGKAEPGGRAEKTGPFTGSESWHPYNRTGHARVFDFLLRSCYRQMYRAMKGVVISESLLAIVLLLRLL